MELPELAIRRTIDLSLLLWLVASLLMLLTPGRWRWSRAAWSLGAGLLLVHIALALHFVHGWSNESAMAKVREAAGVGEGIYASYFMGILWLTDAAWWCLAPGTYNRRPGWVNWAVYAYLAFIIFNGTIVYETGAVRVAGVVGFTLLAVAWWLRRVASGRLG